MPSSHCRMIDRFPAWRFMAVVAAICLSGCDGNNSAPRPSAKDTSGFVHANAPVAKSSESVAVRVLVHTSAVEASDALDSPTVPKWAADAVFYQLFPERFANGDRSNDPTRDSLE